MYYTNISAKYLWGKFSLIQGEARGLTSGLKVTTSQKVSLPPLIPGEVAFRHLHDEMPERLNVETAAFTSFCRTHVKDFLFHRFKRWFFHAKAKQKKRYPV